MKNDMLLFIVAASLNSFTQSRCEKASSGLIFIVIDPDLSKSCQDNKATVDRNN